MKIILKQEKTLQDFFDMESLERNYYGDDHITPSEEAYAWEAQFPYANRLAVDEDTGKIAGFLDLFPVKEEIAQALCSGTFSDRDLTADGIVDIEKTTDAALSLFLCCLVIDDDYRKSGALDLLFQAHLEYYINIAKENHLTYGQVITDNVTEAGERFSRKLGFSKVCETTYNSVIYRGNFGDLTRHFGMDT